jgi:predicted metal-dependent peptidase
MRLQGKELPAPKVALCIDISGSMSHIKMAKARVAGQAIALSVQAGNGHVVGVLFSDDGIMAVKGDASPLFAPLREWQPRGGTSFQFLAHVWRRWPQHLVLLLTDGYGAAPTALPADRARTYAVLIAGDPQRIQPIAAQVLELDDLRALPSLLAMLIPRRRR